MSQIIDLCEDSDDGEWPRTASGPSLQLSVKRPRDKEKSFNEAHLGNENGPENKKTATGSAGFVVDLERADKVEISPHKKRRRVVRSERNVRDYVAGLCLQILKGVEATEKYAGSEDARVADHCESHEGIAAVASHPMDSDSERTSQNDGSTNINSQKQSTSKTPSNTSGRQRRASAWEDRLSEVANYRKEHGNCNVPRRISENIQLGRWVTTQRSYPRFYLEGKESCMTLPRIQALESLSFEWNILGAAWQDRLSELADYHKIQGHCRVPSNLQRKPQPFSVGQNPKEAIHVTPRRKEIIYEALPNQELDSLGFKVEPSIGRGKGNRKKLSLDDDATRLREKVVEAPEHTQQHSFKTTTLVEESAAIKSTSSLSKPKNL